MLQKCCGIILLDKNVVASLYSAYGNMDYGYANANRI